VNIHPKVKAASLAALALAVLAVAGDLAAGSPESAWGKALVLIIALVTPLVAGYAKSSGNWTPAGQGPKGQNVPPPVTVQTMPGVHVVVDAPANTTLAALPVSEPAAPSPPVPDAHPVEDADLPVDKSPTMEGDDSAVTRP
jgi:hypothetical protein